MPITVRFGERWRSHTDPPGTLPEGRGVSIVATAWNRIYACPLVLNLTLVSYLGTFDLGNYSTGGVASRQIAELDLANHMKLKYRDIGQGTKVLDIIVSGSVSNAAILVGRRKCQLETWLRSCKRKRRSIL